MKINWVNVIENRTKRQREKVCYLTGRSLKKSKGKVNYQKCNLSTISKREAKGNAIKKKTKNLAPMCASLWHFTTARGKVLKATKEFFVFFKGFYKEWESSGHKCKLLKAEIFRCFFFFHYFCIMRAQETCWIRERLSHPISSSEVLKTVEQCLQSSERDGLRIWNLEK